MSPEQFLETARAFQESRAILTAIELNLFSAIGGGAAAREAAARLRTDPRATEMLLNALVAIGLLEKRGEVFRNTGLAARWLDDASPESARLGFMHTVNLWERWSTLTACVRAGTAVTYEDMKDRGPEWTEPFIAAMHRNAFERAPEVVRAVGSEGVRRMLDVGGGSGAYSIAFAQASPDLQAEVFDLPAVTAIAARHIREAGLEGRVSIRAGDLRTDDFGSGYDLVWVSAICHMLSPEENRSLLARCFRALAAGGRVAIADFILEPDKTAPKFAALFSLNMLVGTQAGASYSVDEYTAWLSEAGFERIEHRRLPGPAGLMIGARPR
ncbi:MAG: methyltransferase domain-containing protein [Bryobacterales bacterium]|nr:methyltransferase domain-containing protein [Bryobacterales bacterium]